MHLAILLINSSKPASIKTKHILFFVALVFYCASVSAQTPQKQINQQVHSWFSINSTIRLSDRWGMVADFHVRRASFMQDPSFYFARVGANYWINEKATLGGGYAHTWYPPAVAGWKTYYNEHRIYEQALFSSSIGKTTMLQRVRNEQRWHQKMANDAPTGKWRFSNRVRYLLSFNFPVSKKPGKLSVVAADELLLQFGHEILYNTFDQNRLFLGLRHSMSKEWSFDIGYMNVYQQKASGYQYDMNHTFRWFFYYTPDFRKSNKSPLNTVASNDE